MLTNERRRRAAFDGELLQGGEKKVFPVRTIKAPEAIRAVREQTDFR
jgi:hypothetical protein